MVDNGHWTGCSEGHTCFAWAGRIFDSGVFRSNVIQVEVSAWKSRYGLESALGVPLHVLGARKGDSSQELRIVCEAQNGILACRIYAVKSTPVANTHSW